ncbi:hypothetical protein HHI36_003817, partial [Cryptolaemus montrouzieri]
ENDYESSLLPTPAVGTGSFSPSDSYRKSLILERSVEPLITLLYIVKSLTVSVHNACIECLILQSNLSSSIISPKHKVCVRSIFQLRGKSEKYPILSIDAMVSISAQDPSIRIWRVPITAA